MFRHIFAIAVFLCLTATLPARGETFDSGYVPINPPQTLPDFTFQDAKGSTFRLADFRGTAVLLNLWATWCGPCVRELPSLDSLQGQLQGQNFTVIAIDEERNSAEVAGIWFKKHEIKNLMSYSDPSGHIASLLHARGVPVTYLINKEGLAIGMLEGGMDWSSPSIVEFIRENLLSPQNGQL